MSVTASGCRPSIRNAARLVATLRERLVDVLLYRKLATLRRDVPLRESLEDLRHRGVDQARVDAFLRSIAASPETHA